ncbi:unnamed protein product [Moneuplotes crassus]|uniref:Uncharacterized protein n=2 Tax=Euplotes crassus TaxID=5936 RepID=A0AAD1UUS6_EUPCR|nr:unnamed protein product [Moneuplotes crassus]
MNSPVNRLDTVFTFGDFDETNISDEISSEGVSAPSQGRETVGARSMGSSPFAKLNRGVSKNSSPFMKGKKTIGRLWSEEIDETCNVKKKSQRFVSATQKEISVLLQKLAKVRAMNSSL